jgi:hypothetical protein
VDASNVSDISTTPSASSIGIKPVYLKGLFSVSTTSTKSVDAIFADIIRVLHLLGVNFTEIRGGFSCRHVKTVGIPPMGVDLPVAGHRRRISSGTFMNGGHSNHSDSEVESMKSDIPRKIRRTSEYMNSEPDRRFILKFEIFIVKVAWLSLHSIQFKRLAGGPWEYKSMADQILRDSDALA